MNKKPAVLTLSIGIACALVTVVFALDLGGISALLPEAYKAVWGFGGCAAALIICGAFALAHKPTQTELIEQVDERNQAINGKAALQAFEVFSVLMPLVGLALFVVDELSIAGLLTLIGVEVVATVVYFARLARLQKTM